MYFLYLVQFDYGRNFIFFHCAKGRTERATHRCATLMLRIRRKTTISDASSVLDNDAFDDVGDVLATVGDRLQNLVNGLQLDQIAHVRLIAEQL